MAAPKTPKKHFTCYKCLFIPMTIYICNFFVNVAESFYECVLVQGIAWSSYAALEKKIAL